MSKGLNEFLEIFFIGILMGSADILPGISGGTIALITGIYERLINGISNIHFSFIKYLLKRNFKEFKIKMAEEIDFELFIPLILGIGLAFFFLSNIITYLIYIYPAYIYSFFLGLIFASTYILYKKLKEINIKIIGLTIISAILTYFFIGLNPINANHSLITIFFSGLIAVCAMILPGISGSMILVLLGQYNYILNSLSSLNIVEIIVFMFGAIIGILGFSNILRYLIKHYENIIMALLIGVMLGTLRKPIIIITNSINNSIFYGVLFTIIGILLIIILEKKH